MSPFPARIGLIGLGTIGSYVYEQLTTHPELGLEVAFVCDQAAERLASIPPELVLQDPVDFASRAPDLVVEMAHPIVTREHGERFLRTADYMPLSLTALADARLFDRLLAAAREHGTCLFIPHGAAVGVDSLAECRELWDEVTVVMRKNPRNLDFRSAPQFKPEEIGSETVLYDGPTRGVCALFPRNVNSHAAVALAGIGFDRTRSVLIAVPGLDVSIIELDARGAGVTLSVQRANPLQGVSGVFTLRSVLGALVRAKGRPSTLEFC